MKMNALRAELNRFLDGVGCSRPPAVRRSGEPDWLYTTDLPGLCSCEETARWEEELILAGWDCRQVNGWLLLRKSAKEPPPGWFEGPFGPEADCCRSLQERHPEGDAEDAESAQRMLIKAGEEGVEAYEKVCRHLHRCWAEKLRKGEKLPKINILYFGGDTKC